MTEIVWTRVSREHALNVMRVVSSDENAAVFSEDLTEVTSRDLPFYDKLRHYRLINYATLPCFTADYVGDVENDTFIALDGLANTIYDANDSDKLRLDTHNIVDYLDFFLDQVRGPDGDIYLIKSPDDLPMLGSLPENQRQMVITHHRSVKVQDIGDDMGFDVRGTLFYGGSLISARVHVTPTGKLSIHDQELLLQGIHFPMSPVEHRYVSEG